MERLARPIPKTNVQPIIDSSSRLMCSGRISKCPRTVLDTRQSLSRGRTGNEMMVDAAVAQAEIEESETHLDLFHRVRR